MALLDSHANEVVIRVVYDGPPEAGKTTSIRALATSFSRPTVTPEENALGRTQYFDWMEYVGGRFEGSTIRCQIVSVPGQRELRRRRERLVASADVIVFVGDTSPDRWALSLEYLLELHAMRDTAAPVGIVFQANKRDVAGAVGLAEIRRGLGEARWEVGVVESVASDGTGIRESFVYGVRLALDRVRELVARGALRERGAEEGSPAELLAQLIDAEAPCPPAVQIESSAGSVAATLLQEVIADQVEEAPRLPPIPGLPPRLSTVPRPPDASVPSGAIWPPVEGRTILMEVAQVELVPRRHANADWSAGLGTGWRLVSKRDAVFDSLDAGKAALVQWARLHAACAGVVSPHRCIVLAATGDGRWRLWQIVRAEESLRERVDRITTEAEPDDVLAGLYQTAQLLVEVNEKLAEAPCELPCSLDTVGACLDSGMYIGLMPESPVEVSRPRVSSATLLANELGPAIGRDLAERLQLPE